jgi:hypothetical protein
MQLVAGASINERGDIAGLGVLPNGDISAFLLIPCGQGSEACEDEVASATAPSRSNSTLTLPQRLVIRGIMTGLRAGVWRRRAFPIGAPK